MNWMNVFVLVFRALFMGGAAYSAAHGQADLAATLGAAAGAITVAGGYTTPK